MAPRQLRWRLQGRETPFPARRDSLSFATTSRDRNSWSAAAQASRSTRNIFPRRSVWNSGAARLAQTFASPTRRNVMFSSQLHRNIRYAIGAAVAATAFGALPVQARVASSQTIVSYGDSVAALVTNTDGC